MYRLLDTLYIMSQISDHELLISIADSYCRLAAVHNHEVQRQSNIEPTSNEHIYIYLQGCMWMVSVYIKCVNIKCVNMDYNI